MTFRERILGVSRRRFISLAGGSLLVLLYLYLTDPNNGAVLPAFMGQLATPVIAIWFALIMRKVLLDYVNVEELYKKAKETSVGSGIAFLGTCIIMYGLFGLFGSQLAHADTIPVQARTHIPTLIEEQKTYWEDHPFLTCSQLSLNTKAALA